jgi:aspartyl-tRNA(Asn)/glutamyl-tRNA(Gln) amidotransferase subunit C
MAERLTTEQVRHLASLARLRLTDEEVEQYRSQLSSIINYEQRLNELDLAGIEPMAGPGGQVNRLDDDAPGDALLREAIERNAPVMHEGYIIVPKVMEGDGGA